MYIFNLNKLFCKAFIETGDCDKDINTRISKPTKLLQCWNPYRDPLDLTSRLRSGSFTTPFSASSWMDQNAIRHLWHQKKMSPKPNAFDVSSRSILAKRHLERRTAQKNWDVYMIPETIQKDASSIMSSAYPQLTAQGRSSLDILGKTKQRPAKGDMETKCPQKPKDQRSNHGNGTSSSGWQSQIEVPWGRLKHQTVPRGLGEWMREFIDSLIKSQLYHFQDT